MYSVDTNVRRASALQRTMDAKIANGVHINAKLASQLNVDKASQIQVKQDNSNLTLPLVIDDRVPDEGVLIYGGQLANADLGRWHGQVELSAAT